MSTDAISHEPFVFIDGQGNPFKVAWTGIECRISAWSEKEGRWNDLRKITEEYAREFRTRALAPQHAKKYDDRHAATVSQ